LALLHKANLFQSQSIFMDWLCFAKPFRCEGLALLRKANRYVIDLGFFSRPFLALSIFPGFRCVFTAFGSKGHTRDQAISAPERA
jgi:hypothetical protein